jgi:2-dehydro-3-deoxygluconokinase
VIFTLVPPVIPLHPGSVYYSLAEAAVEDAPRRSDQQRLNSGKNPEKRTDVRADLEVVTAGETMVLGTPGQPGRLRHAAHLELKIGGAESNLAIALSRLGIHAGWVSCLGDDEPGQLVLDRVRAEGVDTSRVRRLEDYPTGLYLREKVGTTARVYYYRHGSAASTMEPQTFDREYLEGASFLHLTGITAALSDACRGFTLWAARESKAAGTRVSFDVNYRSKLWSPEDARAFAEEMLPEVDLLFIGDEEARALWGRDDEEFLKELSEKGPPEVVLKSGGEGSMLYLEDLTLSHPGFEATEVDPVGAGDAFNAGYLAGYLWDLGPEERLRVANAMGAMSVATLGDYEGLPDRRELWDFLEGREEMGR